MKTMKFLSAVKKKSIFKRLFLVLLVLMAQGITAQIAVRGTATTASATITSLTINVPTSVVAGDLMIANFATYANPTAAAATSTGWTAISSGGLGGSARRFGTLLYRVATAGEPASYTFSTTAASSFVGAIVAFSGVNTVTPFDVTPTTTFTTSANTASTSLASIAAVTTVTANSAVLMFGISGGGTTTTNANFGAFTATSPATLTNNLYDFGPNGTATSGAVGAAWDTKAAAGTTGAGSIAGVISSGIGGQIIALRPIKKFQSNGSGNWVTAATWQESTDGGTSWLSATAAPTSADGLVTIRNGHTVTLTGSTSSPALTIDAGGTLTPGANLLTLNGDLVNNGTLTSGSGGVTIAGGSIAQNISGFTTTGTVSMTKTSGIATFTGDVNGAGLTMNGLGGTLNLGTGLTHTFTGAWTRTNGTLDAGSSFFKVGGNVSGATGTFTANAGTVEYNGTAQTVAVVSYNNLTLSTSGVKTFGTTPTVNGILSLEGTATVTITTGVVTYGSAATLQYNNRGTFTGTAEECTLTATTNLVIQGTSSITLPANQTLNSLTVGLGATFTLAATQLTINGGLTNNGTISATTGRLNQLATSTADFANTGSIVFTGAGQVAFARNFTNSGTFTLLSTPVTILGGNTQSIVGFTTTGSVSMTKTAGTATFTSNVNGAGLTINGLGGTLNLGTGLAHTFTGAWTRTNGTLDGGSSLFKIGGSVSGSTGTFTANTGTVEYNGAAQTAAVVTYNNLTLSGSAAKTFATTPTVNGILSLEGTATVTVTTGVITYGSGATLQYNNRGTYTGTTAECTLTATTNLVLFGTSTITLPTNQALNSLTVNFGATLTLAATQLAINGGVTNDGSINASTGRLNQVAAATGDFVNTGSIVFTGTGQVAFARNFTNIGTFTLLSTPVTILGGNAQSIAGFTTTGDVSMTKTASSATFAGNVNGAGLTMNGLGGTLNLGTGLTHTFTGAWTRTNGTLDGGSSLLKIAGSVSGATGTFTASTGTVEYNGATQTAAAVIYNNLILSGSGTKTITSLGTVNGNLTMSGDITTTATTTVALVVGGNLTVGAGNTLTLGNNNPALTLTGNASISGTVTSPGSAKTIGGNFTINSGGTWTELAGPAYTFLGNFTNDGTFSAGTSTAAFSGTTQSIGGATATTFNNLTLATNASTKTFGRIINVTGALNVNTGVQANLGTFIHTAGSLTLGASAQGTGASYGGTGSPAGTNNTTFFAATSGVVNVGTCSPYSITATTVATAACLAGASVTLAHTTTSNLPVGTYIVYYSLSGANTGSFNATMNVTTAGSGTFSTGTFSNTGSTSITIDYLRSGCTSITTSGNTASFTVNPNLPASASIAASPATTICSGTNVTFTATPTNGGTPIYQWKLNGVNVGTGSATYSNSALANTDTITVVMTSTATCATGSPATSNTVTMTVNPNLPSSVSIAASPVTTICSGTNVTFTATPTNGGTPSYQWKLNGVNVGSNSSTYSNNTLSNGNTVTVVMTSTATCATGSPATSNTVTMTVNPNLPASVSIAASPSATICSGTNVTFTATPTNGGTPSYQWKLNGVNVGSNSATYSNNALANSDAVTVVMTSTATCATGSPATSNTVTMTVNPNLPASVSIAASPSTTICSGTNVTFTATPTNGGTPSYQWKLNGVNVGSNSSTYSNSALANSDAITVVMTSTATCAAGSPATSNTVTMTVNPNLPASVSIAASPVTTICSGTNVTFTATPTNGGTPSYQWKLNGVNVGSNSSTYSNSALANSDAITVVMTSTATCAAGSPATSNTVTMTVNPNLPASVSIAASPSTTICSGTNVTFTATPTNGGTPSYQWKLNGVNVGSNSATYSNNALANSDAVTVVMTSTATCATGSPATSNTVTMTVNSGSTVAVLSGTTTICGGTANLQVAITGGTAPYTIVYSNGTSNVTVNNYSSGANFSVSPTSTTTYSLVAVTSAQGCIGTGNSGLVTVTFGNCITWNGSAWINGTPTSTSILFFEGNYTVPSNLTAYSIVVNSGTVTVPSGINVTVNGSINVNGGSFILESNANLIQTSTASNSGNITVQRKTSMLKRLDYVLWSSPVMGQQLQSFSPETLANRFYTYDSATNLYTVVSAPSATNFSSGTGYLIRVPNNHPNAPTMWTGTFTGVPTNGTVTLGSLTSNKYYAIGNPYPSTINAEDFIIANNITEALYFWRKTNGANTSAYATHTLAGGAANSAGDPLRHIPNGFIQVGQGFIAKTPTTGTSLTFTNSMRTANNDNQFLRITENRSRIWLDMTNNSDYFGQTMIAYMPNATLGIDAAIDGRYINDFGTALTSLIDSEEFSIQGRPLPFETADVVALGFKSLEADSFAITLSQVDGLFETQGVNVFLKDNLTNTVHNLSLSPYTFATEAGTFNGRFEIVYQDAALALTPTKFNENQVVIYKTPTNEILINSGNVIMSTIKIFDMQGRLLYDAKQVNSSKKVLDIHASNGVLLVQILNKEGSLVTKKFLFSKTGL